MFWGELADACKGCRSSAKKRSCEARPIIVLEWAADQDPTFRRVFCREFLPELKRMGRTVIAISHDDRFFDTADRIVRASDGRIVATSTETPFPFASKNRARNQEYRANTSPTRVPF
ncbi:hypothetical protein AB4Y44_10810 [Paraburkholderia sp. BR10937]|uniref:hypothetical protein n=1 Tax=Paraburkholderia sp. BR10937 TaxID=3236994 RepID=UPI0034D1A5BA